LKGLITGRTSYRPKVEPVALVGGHSVVDTELKYGLSVTGVVHPKGLVTNSGAKAGDRLILTNPY